MVLGNRMNFLWLGIKKQQTVMLPWTGIQSFCLNKLRSKSLMFPNNTWGGSISVHNQRLQPERGRRTVSARSRPAVPCIGPVHLNAKPVPFKLARDPSTRPQATTLMALSSSRALLLISLPRSPSASSPQSILHTEARATSKMHVKHFTPLLKVYFLRTPKILTASHHLQAAFLPDTAPPCAGTDHTVPLPVLRTCETVSNLRAFALAVPSAWHSLPRLWVAFSLKFVC